jgi:hypothetical protein
MFPPTKTNTLATQQNYQELHLAGYPSAAVMFTLPVGSANLVVHEQSATFNNIGLCMIFCNLCFANW